MSEKPPQDLTTLEALVHDVLIHAMPSLSSQATAKLLCMMASAYLDKNNAPESAGVSLLHAQSQAQDMVVVVSRTSLSEHEPVRELMASVVRQMEALIEGADPPNSPPGGH